MVLYRKYRPQTLEELDSDEVRKRLTQIFSSPYIPHAFLFTGTRGTGKTSAARIIAKILNCEKRKDRQTEPCNKCESCLSITAGKHLDIIEIDAASNRGIEEIRDLREKIKLAPVMGKYKVYIIDEVHMLTNEAFNALLKTLEEPPAHAYFILATTEADRIPETILSRCVKINFHKASISETVHCLRRVIKGEGLNFSDDILSQIASSSDGSFRDGTKLLEQIISENAKTPEEIAKLLGRDFVNCEKLVRLLSRRDPDKTLSLLLDLSKQAVNARFLVEDMLELFHKILIARYGLETENVDKNLLDLFKEKEILTLIKLFSRVYLELKNASNPYLPIEVAVVEWCNNK